MAPEASPQDPWILVAKLSGAHGVGGEVKLVSFTADPEAIATFKDVRKGPDGDPLRFRITKVLKGSGFAVRIDGIRDRNAADLMRGTELYVRRSALPDLEEEEYYLTDLIGMTVENEAGEKTGIIRQVEDNGGGDLLELSLDQPVKHFGRVVMLPFTREYVPVVDVPGRRIVARIDAWVALNTEAEKE